ncbi:MAG: Ldh family oxidoreductase, partial [Pseudomonadota bacterium]
MDHISKDRVRLSADEAQTVAEDAFRRMGYDAEEARIIAEHVVAAALCGYEYSGLPKILNVVEHKQLREPRRRMRVLRETSVSTLFDGGNNNGMVTMYRATQVAIAKAREHGMALVGVNNSWMSGRSAHYVEMIARAGLVGIHSVSSTIHVAAPDSREPVTGTNPIAFGFPTEAEPFVIDLGTSAFMGTDLIFQRRREALLPEGVALDAQGLPTRDPAKVHSLLPFGGYKGFALSLAMQALGVLGGSGLGDDK